MEKKGCHLGLSQMQDSILELMGEPGRGTEGAGECGSLWGRGGRGSGKVGGSRSLWGMLVGKLQQGSLTFVCNLASCFSSRLVCL